MAVSEVQKKPAGEDGKEMEEEKEPSLDFRATEAFTKLSEGDESQELKDEAKTLMKAFLEVESAAHAVDIASKFQLLPLLLEITPPKVVDKVKDYLLALARLATVEERVKINETAYQLVRRESLWEEAIRVACIMQDRKLVVDTWRQIPEENDITRKQVSFALGRARMLIKMSCDEDAMETEGTEEEEEDMDDDDENDYTDAMRNAKKSEYFRYVADDLNQKEPKTAEEIFKTHTYEQRATSTTTISSSTNNLAISFVNGLANAAHGADKLMSESGNDWVYKNKEHRMISTVASLGLIHLWDVDVGMVELDKFLYSDDVNIKAGALLGTGVVNCGVYNGCHPSEAVLSDYLTDHPREVRLCSILGLGLAYSGTRRANLRDSLVPLIADSDESLEVAAFAALSLGLVFVGTSDPLVLETVMTVLVERSGEEKDRQNPLINLFNIAMGLLSLGRLEKLDLMLEGAAALKYDDSTTNIGKLAEYTIKMAAHAGDGDTSVIREFMQSLTEKIDEEENAQHQGLAVIGLAMVSMGERTGADMSRRLFEHILQYTGLPSRRAVPLALAMLSVSNPQLIVIDTLSKLSHDSDEVTSMNACLALGFVGAGTNNARVANLLRQLANYYSKEANHLFLVRFSQGMLAMGKGLLTLDPFHSDRSIMDKTAVGGLFAILLISLNLKGTILGQYHHLLYTLVASISPRHLVAVNSDMEPLSVSVRVGQAVDVAGAPGNPIRFTGFQQHDTPVLMGWGDRGAIASEKHTTTAAVIEDVIVVLEKEDKEGDKEAGAKKA